MTRANIVIITPQGKYKFQSNSSAYPSWTMAHVLRFATSTASTNSGATNGFYPSPDSRELSEFIEELGLTLGHVGNPSYFYDIDFVEQTVRVWNMRSRWVNAPADWRERGWNCYENTKGNFGWTSNIKGKLLYDKKFSELVNKVVDFDVILHDNVISEAENIAV